MMCCPAWRTGAALTVVCALGVARIVALDAHRPLLYRLEQRISSLIIPSVHHVRGRRRLDQLPQTDAAAVSFDHADWDACLKAHVRAGATVGSVEGVNVIDYAALGADPRFPAYLDALAAADVDALAPREQLAFWLNAYNALSASLVVSHVRASAGARAPATLHELGRGRTSALDLTDGVVGGRNISLNEIENGRLRAVWDEPGVHACLVCASASCPNLRREAYAAARLEAQVASQLREWLANPTKGLRLEVEGGGPWSPPADSAARVPPAGPLHVRLSRVFLWFETDFARFGEGSEGVRRFLAAHSELLPAGALAALVGGSDSAMRSGPGDPTGALSGRSPADDADGQQQPAALRYFRYDWSINAAPA